MTVSRQQLEHLLELNALDQSLVTKRNQLNLTLNNPEIAELQQKFSAAGVALLEASKVEEAVALELQRNNVDLELVEQRETRDKQRLQAASNPKDVAGLQSELATLARRRSDLEDASLELMDNLAQAQQSVEDAKVIRDKIREEVASLSAAVESEVIKNRSAIDLTLQERARVTGLLSADLLAIYEKKRERSTAVGVLSGPECGACRMTISSAEYSALVAKPADELIFCPECSAILVRP